MAVGRRNTVHRINDGLPNRDEIAAFTAEGGDVEPRKGRLVLGSPRREGGAQVRDGGRIEIEYVVRKGRCARDRARRAAGATYAPLVSYPPDGITGDAFFKRQPRSGIGVTRDGHVLLVTVDGRKPGYSVGMTVREFAQLLQRLCATEALNLDGGGSTAMVVDGVVRNRQRPARASRRRRRRHW